MTFFQLIATITVSNETVLEVFVNKKERLHLKNCPLFAGFDPQELDEFLEQSGAYRQSFSGDEIISYQWGDSTRLGICLSGEAAVYSKGHEKALLNKLRPGAIFGVSSLFSDEHADTVIHSNGASVFLFLNRAETERLLEHPVFRKNLIVFLTGRIRFLTEKITSFTTPTAEKKLALFLLRNADENGSVKGFHSYAELARILNLGRASLYRALEKLEEMGAICRNGKNLQILSQEKMKEIQ